MWELDPKAPRPDHSCTDSGSKLQYITSVRWQRLYPGGSGRKQRCVIHLYSMYSQWTVTCSSHTQQHTQISSPQSNQEEHEKKDNRTCSSRSDLKITSTLKTQEILALSLSLSLSHPHPHTHTHTRKDADIHAYICCMFTHLTYHPPLSQALPEESTSYIVKAFSLSLIYSPLTSQQTHTHTRTHTLHASICQRCHSRI